MTREREIIEIGRKVKAGDSLQTRCACDITMMHINTGSVDTADQWAREEGVDLDHYTDSDLRIVRWDDENRGWVDDEER